MGRGCLCGGLSKSFSAQEKESRHPLRTKHNKFMMDEHRARVYSRTPPLS